MILFVCMVHDAGSGYECSPVVEEDCNDIPDLCDAHAQCLYDADLRRYTCRCNRGFEGDGQQCARVGKLFTLAGGGLRLDPHLKNSKNSYQTRHL